MKRAALVTLLAYVALPAWAAEYHVTTTGGGAACTSVAPCATIAAGLAVAGASDTLSIHSGTYTEAISTATTTITGGSSEGTRLTIRAYPGDTVLLQPASGTRVIFLADSDTSWITISNLRLNAANVSAEVIKITCTGALCETTGTNASSHIRLSGIEAYNSPVNGILISGVGSTFNELLGSDVHTNGTVANLEHCVYISTDDNLIHNNRLHGCAANGLHIFDGEAATDPDRNVVSHNLAYNNGLAGASGEGLQVSGVDNELLYNMAWDNTTGAGISVFDSADTVTTDTIVTGNRTWGNTAHIDVSAGATGTVQSNNLTVPPLAVSRGSVLIASAQRSGTVAYAR